ncbi:MAG: SPOR domain-containing protein [Magnetococcales bacterium]|nr:SPOR domain-containing protein [Magnetococcales bacterium]
MRLVLSFLALLMAVSPLAGGSASANTSRPLTKQDEQALERQVWLRINQMAMDPTAGADALVEPVTILVDLYLEQGRHAKAESVLQMAINQLSGKSSTVNTIPLMRLSGRMARIDLAYGRFELASRQFNQLLTLNHTKEAFTPAQEQELRLGLARTRVGMALAVADQPARLSRSGQLLMVAIPELAQYLGDKHPEVLNARIQYLNLLTRQGVFDQVREEVEPLLATFLRIKPPKIAELAQIYRFRGWALAQSGHVPAALESLGAGMALLPPDYMGELQHKARLLVDLAVVYLGDRRPQEALAALAQLESVVENQFGRGTFKQARLQCAIGLALEKQGNVEEGRQWTKKAQSIGHLIFDKEPHIQEKWWSELQGELKKTVSPGNPLELERQLTDVVNHLFMQVENMASWRERLATWIQQNPGPSPAQLAAQAAARLSEREVVAPPAKRDGVPVPTADIPTVATSATKADLSRPIMPGGGVPLGTGTPAPSTVVGDVGGKPVTPSSPATLAFPPAAIQEGKLAGADAYQAPPRHTLKGFYLSLGCFSQEKNSLEALHPVAAKGLPVYQRAVSKTDGSLYCAVSGPYAAQSAADNARDLLKESGLPDYQVKSYGNAQ